MNSTTTHAGSAVPTGAAPSFVAYEYSTIVVPRDKEALYRDSYQAFGWSAESYGSTGSGVTLKLKRDRALRSREVLTELQRTTETALRTITGLERSRSTAATIISTTIGIVGAAFLAGSIFAMDPVLTVLSVVLGAVGLIGWVLPWFVHRAIAARRTAQVKPLIDHQYDVISDSCARAASLLA